MAGVAGDAHTPIYGYQWRLYVTTFNSAGTPTAPTAPDSEASLDGATFADCTNELVQLKEVGGSTDSPHGYLDLTAAEMTAGEVHLQVKGTGIVTQPVAIYPRVLPVWLTGTAQTGGSTTTIKLAAGAPAYDISGCWVGVDSGTYAGQVRKIASYDTGTKIATVKRAFGGAPDSATYSILVPEAMQGALAVRIMLALPAYAAGAASGLAIVGSVMGKSPATLASTDVSGNIAADLQTIKTQAVTAAAGVTFPASIGTGTYSGTPPSAGDNATAAAAAILATPAQKLKTDASGRIEVSGTKNTLDDLNDPSASDIDTQLSSTHGAGAWGSGTGASSKTYTVTDSGTGLPLAGVYVRLTTDSSGLVQVDAGTTSAAGTVVLHHDLSAGTTVYLWRSKAGYEFTDPDTETI